jgi:transposase
MLAQRAQQQTEGFKGEYKRRAGVEGTVSQGLRVGGLRQSRYVGLAKTRLQHILIAVALNLLRLVAWYDARPLAKTRRSAFAALASSLGLTPLRAAAGF